MLPTSYLGEPNVGFVAKWLERYLNDLLAHFLCDWWVGLEMLIELHCEPTEKL